MTGTVVLLPCTTLFRSECDDRNVLFQPIGVGDDICTLALDASVEDRHDRPPGLTFARRVGKLDVVAKDRPRAAPTPGRATVRATTPATVPTALKIFLLPAAPLHSRPRLSHLTVRRSWLATSQFNHPG